MQTVQPPARRAASAVTAAAAAVLLAAGCSSGPAASVPAQSSPGSPSASSASSASAGAAVAAVAAASVANDPAARKDVAMTACSGDSAGWTAAGTVSNAGDAAAAYTIVVSFTDSRSTVLARETAKVSVDPGGKQDWKVDARFKAPEGVVCVLRGVDRA